MSVFAQRHVGIGENARDDQEIIEHIGTLFGVCLEPVPGVVEASFAEFLLGDRHLHPSKTQNADRLDDRLYEPEANLFYPNWQPRLSQFIIPSSQYNSTNSAVSASHLPNQFDFFAFHVMVAIALDFIA